VSGNHVVFLLSPANCSGIRASYLLRSDGASALARRLHAGGSPTIGEIFTFMSGLYFRGKVAYAARFAAPPGGCCGVNVIVPGLGLLPADCPITLAELRAVADVPVDHREARYTGPLRRDARHLAGRLGADDAVVLLGSIATRKYLDPLRESLGDRLRIPAEFVGRGDMSRGSLLLKCVAEGRQLTYVPGTGVFSRAGVTGSR
jgi:hypothetical protein